SLDDLKAQTAAIVDDVKELHASLDGVEIPNLFDHRAASPVFNIFYTNANNIHSFAFGHPITGLIDPMVCDGYWLMFEPLPPGPHVLHFGGSYSNAFFTPTDVLDYITVVAIPFPERIQKLIATLKVSNLSQRLHRSLLKELIQANKDFERNRVSEGVEELREFQKKVRQEVADSALAEQL